jgi:hypothetical protein
MRRARSCRLGNGGGKNRIADPLLRRPYASANTPLPWPIWRRCRSRHKPGKRIIHHRCFDRHDFAPRHAVPSLSQMPRASPTRDEEKDSLLITSEIPGPRHPSRAPSRIKGPSMRKRHNAELSASATVNDNMTDPDHIAETYISCSCTTSIGRPGRLKSRCDRGSRSGDWAVGSGRRNCRHLNRLTHPARRCEYT